MKNYIRSYLPIAGTPLAIAATVLFCIVSIVVPCRALDSGISLHDATINRLVAQLESPKTAPTAADNLGLLRAYSAADALAAAAESDSVETRRAACLSLAWCGGRKQIPVLLKTLERDEDWTVRQAAWVALTNLTGMEFPYESHAKQGVPSRQTRAWRDWWATVQKQKPQSDLIPAATATQDLAAGCPVTASSSYKGPASILTGHKRGEFGFWQTKNVPFPQHCTIDLGTPQKLTGVVISQYGKGFCMTDYAIETSADGKVYREVLRKKGPTSPNLPISFKEEEARYLRIVSYASENSLYPTTFYTVGAFEQIPDKVKQFPSSFLSRESAMRRLGCLGIGRTNTPIIQLMSPYISKSATEREEKLMVQAGIRALGRLHDKKAQSLLIDLLENAQWARYAADALGDFGGKASAEALIDAYPSYAMSVTRKRPPRLPRDDRPGFEAVDRMYETPYSIALALSRFALEDKNTREELRSISHLLVANMASDFDGAMIYEEQAFQKVTAYILERAGTRREVCEIAFEALGQPSSRQTAPRLPQQVRANLLKLAKGSPGGTSFAATWITALCRDKDYVPLLIRLLEHDNGWIRINAAKTLMFMNAESAVVPIARLLKESKTEAEHGYFTEFLFRQRGKQGQDESNAQSPCWREAFTRALGHLGTKAHVPLLIKLLNDDRNVLEIRYSAALSLEKLGTSDAIEALRTAASQHSFHSIRLIAREALWKRGLDWDTSLPSAANPRPSTAGQAKPKSDQPEALVFIKGNNTMPNRFQIDPWRQAYSTTDSGPTYRIGDNLYLLRPVKAEGKVTPLTEFTGGYVADCEVSWGGTHVVFARREDNSPWWHIYELELESGKLMQLTDGPYHDVQPTYLPDGRIVFSSSRTGMRDEYHGYPATGLTVMNRDGTGIHCIGFNLGRDNEPAMLPDGSIVFGRLELFYSRLKTEITVQTVRPDGTMNQTIYGPEKRDFWHRVQRASRDGGWGENPPRHRVLRLTQPQPFGEQQVIVATTGGATIVGPGRLNERIIPRWNNMTVTSPYPIGDNRVLCASTVRKDPVDLGIYTLDTDTGELTLVYNDPATADFEARPIVSRSHTPSLPNTLQGNTYTARLICNSARTSQEAITRSRGKLVRIVEGQPVTGRHHTHTNPSGEAWKNHTGTHGRILGTVPLAPDGSFFVEIPADRLIHCQVLDSDRRVVGNQLIWMYARPGETRSCVGCHENPDSAAVTGQRAVPFSAKHAPIKCLPVGNEFSYRAKAWQKGTLLDETEERTRTVNAVSLPGRL